MKSDLVATVGSANVLLAAALDRDLVTFKAGLGAKNTPGASLAGQTVTNRDSNWFAFRREPELSATACGRSGRHNFLLHPMSATALLRRIVRLLYEYGAFLTGWVMDRLCHREAPRRSSCCDSLGGLDAPLCHPHTSRTTPPASSEAGREAGPRAGFSFFGSSL